MGNPSKNIPSYATALNEQVLKISGEPFGFIKFLNNTYNFFLTVGNVHKVGVLWADFTRRFQRVFDPLF